MVPKGSDIPNTTVIPSNTRSLCVPTGLRGLDLQTRLRSMPSKCLSHLQQNTTSQTDDARSELHQASPARRAAKVVFCRGQREVVSSTATSYLMTLVCKGGGKKKPPKKNQKKQQKN